MMADHLDMSLDTLVHGDGPLAFANTAPADSSLDAAADMVDYYKDLVDHYQDLIASLNAEVRAQGRHIEQLTNPLWTGQSFAHSATVRNLRGLLKTANGVCSHHAPHDGDRYPHVVKLAFADMDAATYCYHLLNDLKNEETF